MSLFGKREMIFRCRGDRERWKKAKETLKKAGIHIMEAGSYEGEVPLCSCGAKVDRRNYGPNGWIDRRMYYLSVKPDDAVLAANLLCAELGAPIMCEEPTDALKL